MRGSMVLARFLGLVLLFPSLAAPRATADDAAPAKRAAQSSLVVWDTNQTLAESPASAAAAPEGWKQVPPGTINHSFTGDVVVQNGRFVAAVRRQAGIVEVQSLSGPRAGASLHLRVLAADGQPATSFASVRLVENAKAALTLAAMYRTAGGAEVAAKFRIKRGERQLQIEPLTGADRLRVECPARFVVLPDFFADDIVIDANRIAQRTIDVPSDNFLLQLLGTGDALAMCVFENRQQDVKLLLEGNAAQRQTTGAEIAFETKKIWVALLEAPRIWHSFVLRPADTGKVLSLDWTMPFAAQWRVDFSRPDQVTDSWEMLLKQPTGEGYLKPSWLGSGDQHLDRNRRRWNTVLGTYPYPCWTDTAGKGYVQPIKNEALRFEGPLLLYPINRVQQTPLDVYTVVDVMRNTLGAGPCEHLLDLEGQKAEYRGRATCSCRDRLGEIYGSGRQKELRSDVDKVLDDGLIFVKHIRSRITRYVEFGHKLRDYLAAQKRAQPELAGPLSELEALVQQIDERFAARADKIQTPAYVAHLNDEFRRNVLDDDGPQALKHCKEYSEALVTVGDNQDELSAECRWVVKTLRQRAGLLLATDPRLAAVASEIRAQTQTALRNPASHEGARH